MKNHEKGDKLLSDLEASVIHSLNYNFYDTRVFNNNSYKVIKVIGDHRANDSLTNNTFLMNSV